MSKNLHGTHVHKAFQEIMHFQWNSDIVRPQVLAFNRRDLRSYQVIEEGWDLETFSNLHQMA
jgi:hypothetical protein